MEGHWRIGMGEQMGEKKKGVERLLRSRSATALEGSCVYYCLNP